MRAPRELMFKNHFNDSFLSKKVFTEKSWLEGIFQYFFFKVKTEFLSKVPFRADNVLLTFPIFSHI